MGRRETRDTLTSFGKKYEHVLKQLKAKPFVKVGILQADFDKPKKVGPGESPSDMTVGEVGAVHEFGAPEANIPERSFIRSTADAKQNNLFGGWAGQAEELKNQINKGDMTIPRALGVMGLTIKKDIQEKIRSDIPPVNAPSTLKKKAPKTKTLIDTGQLLNVIQFEVQERRE